MKKKEIIEIICLILFIIAAICAAIYAWKTGRMMDLII